MTYRDLEHYPKHTATGTGFAILSNRISFFYNLHGPSVTLDTACSSSLVGFHMATQSIRNDEAEMAIVVGSAIHFDPNFFLTMTDMNFLSPDGRCRAFDAKGRGYARGEGICAVVLKRKDLAWIDGNTLRAAVCGTAINHDGHNEGLTMPNSKAQESLMADLYKSTGLPTNETSYFEAHGTGTPAGDPREMRAIGSVFASSRTQPLNVGSIKTNIGHLEGASGLAGVIKTTLSLEAGKILPNMHFNVPNPDIDFKQWKVTVPTQITDWEPVNGVRRASINSFGYGGSNAHIILQGVEKESERLLTSDVTEKGLCRPFLMPLTSHSKKAGDLLTETLANFVKSKKDVSPANLARSLSNPGRSLHRHRSFFVESARVSTLEKLKIYGESWARSSDDEPRIGFVFTGQGAQWFAMGRQLIEQHTFFRQTLERCDKILHDLPNKPDWTCTGELQKSKEDSRVNEFAMSSPLCCAIQLAVVDLLCQWNIRPTAAVGHSSGEIPAAYAAGILSLDDAIVCAYQRGFVLNTDVEGKYNMPGAMIAVGMTEEDAIQELEPYGGRACVAAVNSFSSLTLSGDEDAILRLKEDLEKRQIFVRRLQVERAFHSHHMSPYASALADLTNKVTPHRAACRMISSVTGQTVKGTEMTGTYFATNLTHKVRFAEALSEMLLNDMGEQAVDMLLEIGAHPALKAPSRHTLQSLKLEIPYLGTLDREIPAFESLLTCAGQVFTTGYPVNLEAVNSIISLSVDGSVIKNPAGRKLALPSYSWDHGRYWSETRISKNYRLRKHRHSLLGIQLPASTDRHPRWRRLLRLSELPWLSHHKIEGTIIFPAAGYLTMAIEAALRLEVCPKELQAIVLHDVAVKSALELSDRDSGTEILLELQPVRISAKRSSKSRHSFSIISFNETGVCVEHCHGIVEVKRAGPNASERRMALPSMRSLKKRTNKSQSVRNHYRHLEAIGLQYGEAFRLIDGKVDSGNGFAMASVTLHHQHDGCVLHPTFLDAALHPIFAGLESSLGRPLDQAFVPTFLHSMEVSGAFLASEAVRDTQKVWVCVETAISGPRIAMNDISIRSEDGSQEFVSVKSLEATALGSPSAGNGKRRSLFFRTRWQPAFFCLGEAQQHSPMNISQLMDLHSHQFPNCKVLHVTSNKHAVEEVLHRLGGRGKKQRRFQSLTPHSFDTATDWAELKAQSPDFIDFSPPKPADFDLVIVEENSTGNFAGFLKPGGFLIANDNAFETQDLSKFFGVHGLSAWRKQDALDTYREPLTLITSDDCSDDTESLVSAICEDRNDSVRRLTLSDVSLQGLHSTNVIVLCSLDEDYCFDEAQGSEAANFAALKTLFENTNRNIMWITRGGSMECPNPEQAMIHGLTRTARNENEKLKIVVLDIDEDPDPCHITSYIEQILSNPLVEEEFTAREGVLYIPRIEIDDDLNDKLSVNAAGKIKHQRLEYDQPFSLAIGTVGMLETLSFSVDSTTKDSVLAEDEIEIDVKASTISSRDIAAAAGAVDDYNLGDECAGIVRHLGSKVTDFEVGDRVVAWRPGQGAHRTRVRNPAAFSHKVGTLPFTTASQLPLVLTTAYYALMDLARLQPGENVLIHTACGGVGQMAIQLAQMVGAEIIATCGSQSKHDYLKDTYGLKDKQILYSRDASFVDGVESLTDGKGVDVVLNSLDGDLLHASWSCVARFGRFIEIRKRDIHENGRLDMSSFRRNVSFHSLDLITIYEHSRPLGARLLRESMKLLEQGKITPLKSLRELSYADAEEGFRLAQKGDSIGKVVLTRQSDDIVPMAPGGFSNAQLFNGDKVYLIVGGLGGLGRTLAEWMVRRGARSLAFMSRSGDRSAQAKDTISWLKDRDIVVQTFAADVADYDAVKACIDTLGARLAGVFHAAMVLQDSPLDIMSHEEWQNCIRPKVLGAQNLHHTTSHLNLDFFIPFSSVSAPIGALAQANYAAANCYLDALVCHRRERGLKASTINIGMIKGAGVVDNNAALEKIMLGLGIDQITDDEFLYQVQEAVEASSAPAVDERGVCRCQSITGVNMARKDYYWARNSLFRNLYSNHNLDESSMDSSKSAGSLLQTFQNAPDTPLRISILTTAFLDKISILLGVSREVIHPSNPLSAYGLDSIVAVEIRKWFSGSVRVDLALFDILNAKSIAVLVEKAVGIFVSKVTATVDPLNEVEERQRLRVTTSLGSSVGEGRGTPDEALARRWQDVDRAIKVPNVTVEVVAVEDEEGPSGGAPSVVG